MRRTPPSPSRLLTRLRRRALLFAVSAADSVADSVRSGISLASSSLASATAAPGTVVPTMAAVAQKVSLQLSVQGGSSQDDRRVCVLCCLCSFRQPLAPLGEAAPQLVPSRLTLINEEVAQGGEREYDFDLSGIL